MADNYLEKQYEAYEARKAAWEKERKYGKKPSPAKRPKTEEKSKGSEETSKRSEASLPYPLHTEP